MSWFASTVIVLVSLASLYTALWLLFGWQIFGNNLSRFDFALKIRSMLILRENGGYLDIRHRGSQRRLRVYRESGGDDDAKVVIRVQHEPSSHSSGAEILDLLRRHGHEPSITPAPEASIAIPVDIADIWAAHSAVRAARVVHLALDAWGIGIDERFDLRIRGVSSMRWLRHLQTEKEHA